MIRLLYKKYVLLQIHNNKCVLPAIQTELEREFPVSQGMHFRGIVILFLLIKNGECYEQAKKSSCQNTCLQYYPNLTFSLAEAFNPTYGIVKKTNMPMLTKYTSRVRGSGNNVKANLGNGFSEHRLKSNKIFKKANFHIDDKFHIICSGTFCIQFGE